VSLNNVVYVSAHDDSGGIYELNSNHDNCGLAEKIVRGRRRGGLMVSAVVSGSSGPGSSPGRGHCVVFLGKILNSLSPSLHPGV